MLVDRKILVERDGEWALEQTRALPVPGKSPGNASRRASTRTRRRQGRHAGRRRSSAPRSGSAPSPTSPSATGPTSRPPVRRLEQRHLVRRRHESSVAGDAEYVFEHALIRDVAYRSTVRHAARRATPSRGRVAVVADRRRARPGRHGSPITT